MYQRLFLFLGLFFISIHAAFATHNRAGEITYVQTGPLSFRFTVTTYTDPSVQADRCSLTLKFSTGDSITVLRVNGPTPCDQNPNAGMGVVIVPQFVKLNLYEGSFTFPGPGKYRAWMEDPNRTVGSNNIPGSVNQPFYLESTIRISSSITSGGYNSSPVLLNPPIDQACFCKRFVHNPNAIDPDPNDVQTYKLVPCKGTNGAEINNNAFPNGATINEQTGDFIWECPGALIGEYNFAILIISWRNGVVMDTVRRDLQVLVKGGCINDPPVLEVQDQCVDAGDTLRFPVVVNDPNGNNVTLTSTGLVYSLSNNPPTFQQPTTGPVPLTVEFEWATNCSHVRKNPYQVSFKAVDIPNDPDDQLADIKNVKIRVVSPGPTDLTVVPQGNSALLSWFTCPCNQALGYKIYRKNGPSGFVPGPCETGIPASTGYQAIATVAGVGTLNFTDNNQGQGLVHGQEYCYMIYAYFQDGSESYASNEVCVELKKDVPIITNVSVNVTANPGGENYIAWSRPSAAELDTIAFPGPYRYLIYRSPGSNGLNLALTDSTNGINDTTYTHSIVNTENNSNSYRIDFYSLLPQRTMVGSTTIASSVFLEATPSDNQITLMWTTNVPWTEDSFVVFKQNPSTLGFDSLTTTTIAYFLDTGLVNGRDYCYLVKSKGKYPTAGLIDPIINFSQVVCAQPIDNVPPCAPDLSIAVQCDSVNNILSWNDPNESCSDDVLQFRVYYTPVLNGSYTIIATLGNLPPNQMDHNNNGISIAGCYYITALDSVGNESISSDTVCVDNCPTYDLPNVFTPNGDGNNDFFRPFPYKYVEGIEMQIFNRWGALVFETNDPQILWNGTNQQSGQPSSDGVYYYVCKIKETRLEGTVERTITGFVQLYNSPININGN
jgi:gliding motility-associated-like protein